MKVDARKQACVMRTENGASIGEIAISLSVSKSTVSRWVKDICLTEEQLQKLSERNPIYNNQVRGSNCLKQSSKVVRQQYQEEGRQRARRANPLHLAGCMLYWAEGSKSRNVLTFTNSDPDMVSFFVRFLRCCYDLTESDITVCVNCFDDCHSAEDIERFWLEKLSLPVECLRKTTLNYHSSYSQKKRCNTLAYGTCRINVCRTHIVQSIYGALAEYVGLDAAKWLE